jgi:hypothetical protein
MGSNNSVDNIPKTAKNFKVTFIDQTDISTECTDVSIAGQTFLEGKKGDGVLTINFENIKNISFLNSNGNLKGLVRLKDGNSLEIALIKDQKAYGRTKYGAFQIKLNDLKKIIF